MKWQLIVGITSDEAYVEESTVASIFLGTREEEVTGYRLAILDDDADWGQSKKLGAE